ncbi:MAG: hypothetical protein ACXWG8_04960 [Usitatibacter sp.]
MLSETEIPAKDEDSKTVSNTSRNDYMCKMRLVSFVACILAIGGSHAGGTQLLQPVDTSLVFLDGDSGASLGRAGVAGSTPPAWILPQWGIQSSLQPAPGDASGWTIANQYARVQYYPQIDGGQNVYELAQAGASCNHERDLFLQTGGTVAGSSPGITTSAALSTLGSIRVDVGLNVSYDYVPTTCSSQGYWDYSQYVYSIILGSSTGQTLFYQVDLGRSADPGQNPNVGWCPGGYEDTANDSFCLDDDIRNLGGSWVAPYNNVVNSIDFLPRILQILAAGHQKASYPTISLDQDPSHWTMGAVYVGDIVQGGAISTTRWYDLGLRTFQGGTFCNGSHAVQWSCYAGQPDGSGWVDVGSGCYHRDTGLACY